MSDFSNGFSGTAAPEMRPNPMIWTNEEAPTGVFIGDAPDGLSLLGLPQGATTQRRLAALIPDKASPRVITFLETLKAALSAQSEDEPARLYPLDGFDADEIALIDDVCGEGEVTAAVGEDPVYQITESTLTGLWRVRAATDEGRKLVDRVEVGDLPGAVRAAALGYQGPMPDLTPDILETLPEGVMNAPSVLAEIRAKSEQWTGTGANEVLNFTLLPMTPDDVAFVARMLGQAPITIVSGGYGTARITATRVRHVWGVQYLNGMGKVILDTIEIGDVPSAARAARVDFLDSAERLGEIMEAYL
jgi:hydrogenase-1 operon protein HyaF